MRANPGGEISPDQVVGRDRLITRIWDTLRQQSIVLVAERRMGKSSVTKKMTAEPRDGIICLYRDVESIDTPIAFAERVYHDLEEYLSRSNRVLGRTRSLLKHLSGTEIAGLVKLPDAIAPHWKDILEKTIEDLSETPGELVVLFWDEFPLMLQKIRDAKGESIAMDVLDVLRGLRQMYPRVRMVFTGSIGLHHVTTALRNAGHKNDSTNDMRTIEVPELPHSDAQFLALELLNGETLRSERPEATAAAIAAATDCIPFYIHSVVSTLKDHSDYATPELAARIVADALVDPQDTWHLQHYYDRLPDYYGADRLPVVVKLLDALAVATDPLSFSDLYSFEDGSPFAGPAPSRATSSEEDLQSLLTLLQRDHYLVRQSDDGCYRFRFQIVKRWWRLNRNLR